MTLQDAVLEALAEWHAAHRLVLALTKARDAQQCEASGGDKYEQCWVVSRHQSWRGDSTDREGWCAQCHANATLHDLRRDAIRQRAGWLRRLRRLLDRFPPPPHVRAARRVRVRSAAVPGVARAIAIRDDEEQEATWSSGS